MSDLSEIQASQSVKLAGSDPATGIETNWAVVDSNGILSTRIYDAIGSALTSTLVSAKQALDVYIVNSLSTGVADKTAFTYGTTTFTNSGGVYQDTSPTLTAGQQGIVRLTSYRAFHSNLRDNSGNELIGQKAMVGSVPVVISSDQSALSVTLPYDKNYDTVGANTLRTAAQIGNSTGAADFNAGATGAQTLRVVIPTDQTAIPVAQSGVWNVDVTGTEGFCPGPDSEDDNDSESHRNKELHCDPDGSLQVRATVLTDEQSYREDFSSALTSTVSGTVTFTNNSRIVT
jgi:hypothetical protein